MKAHALRKLLRQLLCSHTGAVYWELLRHPFGLSRMQLRCSDCDARRTSRRPVRVPEALWPT